MAHVWNLHIRDRTTRGNGLELAFKTELAECVDLLADIHMIRVRIIALVCDVFDRAETLLVDSCETIAEAFCRCAIQTETKTGFFLPCITSLAQTVHNTKGKFLTFRFGVALASHKLCYLVQADITKGDCRVSILQ